MLDKLGIIPDSVSDISLVYVSAELEVLSNLVKASESLLGISQELFGTLTQWQLAATETTREQSIVWYDVINTPHHRALSMA